MSNVHVEAVRALTKSILTMSHRILVTRIVTYAHFKTENIGNHQAFMAARCALNRRATRSTILEGVAACCALAFISKVVPVDALRAAGRGAAVFCTVLNRTALHNLTVLRDEFIACASTFFCDFRDVQTHTICLVASQAFYSMNYGT